MTATTAVRAHPLRVWDYFTLNAYWFALSFMWNSMAPLLLPTLVQQFVPATQKGSALGALSAIGLIIATMVQPVTGAWSDAHTTRWGKRRPYIVGGTLLDVVFLLLMVFAGNYVALAIGYVLLQTSSNIAHGPYQGYIPELVPEAKRGAVTGVKQFLEIIGIIITSLLVGRLVDQGQLVLAFGLIIVFLLFTMALTALCVTEQPFDGVIPAPAAQASQTQSVSPWRALFYSRDFFLWLVSRLLILVGANLARNYVLYFLGDVLKLSNAATEAGNLLAILGLAIVVVVYPAGALSDRIGRKRLIVVSGGLGVIGALGLTVATTMPLVIAAGTLIGISIGIFLTVNWAWGADLIPSNAGGRFLGISNLATAGAGVVAGAGGWMLDFFNAQSPNLGYPALYLTAALCYALGTLIVFGVQDTQRKKE